MGLAMLKHLVKHGYQVTACDSAPKHLRRPAKSARPTANSPAELAQALRSSSSSASATTTRSNAVVLRRRRPVRPTLRRGSIIAVSSTATPDTVQALESTRKAEGHRRARRADLPRAVRRRRRHAAGAGRRRARCGGARPRGLPQLLLRLRASRRCRPRPGRQDHEQPAALDQRGRPDRGRAARRDHRHRSREVARRAA